MDTITCLKIWSFAVLDIPDCCDNFLSNSSINQIINVLVALIFNLLCLEEKFFCLNSFAASDSENTKTNLTYSDTRGFRHS